MLYIEEIKEGDKLVLYARTWDIEKAEEKKVLCAGMLKAKIAEFNLSHMKETIEKYDVVDLLIGIERAEDKE